MMILASEFLRRSRVLILCASAPILLSGCNSGLLAIFSSNQSDDANAQGVVAALEVLDARQSPAVLKFTLIDQEGDPVELEFLYQLPGDELRSLSHIMGEPTQGLAASASGLQHELTWDFAAEVELDSTGLNPGVLVFVRQAGSEAALIDGANSATVDLGNDPPKVLSVQIPAAQPSAIVLVEIEVSDSSSELIDLLVEFDVQGDAPDLGWQSARPAGQSTTTSPTMQDVLALASGSSVQFFWDSGIDLASTNSPVTLRVTANDGSEVGPMMLSPTVDVSNNSPPLVLLDELTLDASTDRDGGVPIPFRVFDAEEDLVTVILQWRQEGTTFPQLPSSAAELQAAISDPVQRRALQIGAGVERRMEGTLVAIDETRVRLVDLEEEFSELVGGGFEGLTLSVMASGSLRDITAVWQSGGLSAPVAVESLASGGEVLVLEALSGDAWSLKRVTLLTGAATTLATGNGAPVALAVDRDRALVASQSGSDWQLATVDVELGGVVISGFGSGELRDIAARNGRLVLATVDQGLVQIGLTDDGAQVTPIVSGLADPVGVALDPFSGNFAYVSERALDRVVRVDLEFRLITELKVSQVGGGAGFPAPRDLVVSGSRRELLVACESSPGVGELRSIPLARGPAEGELAVLAETVEVAAPTSRLAVGPNGVLYVADPVLGQVSSAGGIEQQFTIAEREGLTNVMRLDAAFVSLPETERRCRIHVPAGATRGRVDGAFGEFMWDTSELPGGGERFLRVTGFDGASSGQSDDGNFPIVLSGGPVMGDIDLGLPGAPSVADLDGDGDYDLIIGESGATRVSIQGPAGVFTLDPIPIAFTGTSGPAGALAVIAVDLDGDGRLDLVAPAPDGLQIAYQQADASFEAPISIPAPGVTSPGTEALAADFDGDGQVELLSVHAVFFGAGSIFLYENQGGQTWTSELLGNTFAVNSAHLRDADADGDLDIVINDASYLEQTSPLTFEVTEDALLLLGREEWGPGVQGDTWHSFLHADLGEDGLMDMLVNRHTVFIIFDSPPPSANSLGRFTADGEGSFTEVSPYEPLSAAGTGTVLAKLEMGDLDGDGRLEALGFDGRVESPWIPGTNFGRGELLVLSPDARGEEWRVTGRPLVTNSLPSHSMPIVDLDGDGELDLLQRGADGDAHWFAFDSRGAGLDPDPVVGDEVASAPNSNFFLSVRACDLDRDGDLDLLCQLAMGSGGNSVVTLLQGASRVFSQHAAVGLPNGSIPDFELLDFDLDGALDLVAMNNNGHLRGSGINPQWSGGNGDGTFQYQTFGAGGPRLNGGSDVADIDLDGHLDLIQMAKLPNWVESESVGIDILLANAGGPGAPLHVSASDSIEDFPFYGVSAADIDGNGLPDIATGNLVSIPSDPATDQPVMVFYQTSPLEFAPTLLAGITGAPLGGIEARDLDQDGRCDLVWTERSPGDSVVVAWQEAEGSFTTERFAMGSAALDRLVTGLDLVDLDGNGRLDIVVLGQGTLPTVLSQRMRRQFEVQHPMNEVVAEPSGTSGGLVLDLDGDGSLDVLRFGGETFGEFELAVHWGGQR